MEKLLKKFFMMFALFATIFSASSASASEPLLSTMKVDKFVEELQKNLADKMLQVNDLQRLYAYDLEGNELLAWRAILAPKGSSADGGDAITFYTNKNNQLVVVGIKIGSGATQNIVDNNFWTAALTALNFTADERTQILKGGTKDENGTYSYTLQRSPTEKFTFMRGKSEADSLFSFITSAED